MNANDGYWDATSDPHHGDKTEGATSSGRPWWQGSYSLRMWGPEFLPVQAGAGADLRHASIAHSSSSSTPCRVRCSTQAKHLWTQQSCKLEWICAGARPGEGGQGPGGALVTDGTVLAEGRGGTQQTTPTVLESPRNGICAASAIHWQACLLCWTCGLSRTSIKACDNTVDRLHDRLINWSVLCLQEALGL